MTGLEVVGDLSGMWQEGIANVASGVSGLGADELGRTTQALADALDVFAGTVSIVSLLASMRAARNSIDLAEVVAKATALASNPLTWAWLAAAVGAGAATAAFSYSVVRNHRLKANLANPSESLATALTVGAIV